MGNRGRPSFAHRLGLALGGLAVRAGLQRVALKVVTFARLWRYVHRFGFREGLRVWWAFLFGEDTIHVALEGYGDRIKVRCGTPDPTVFERIFLTHEYAAAGALEDCATILDCGAYVGYSTLYFARRFPKATVIAVEPDDANAAMLRHNTSECPNVVCVQTGLWSRPCGLRIRDATVEPWSFALEEGGTMAATTVGAILRDHAIESVDFVKMDIEGAEREVFKLGWETWLPNVRMMIIELHDYMYPGASDSFFAAIDSLDFDVRSSGENVIVTRAPTA